MDTAIPLTYRCGHLLAAFETEYQEPTALGVNLAIWA